SRARCNVASSAAHFLVRSDEVRRELRLHHMTALPAELHGLHVFHRTIGQLASDDDIRECHHSEENAGPAPGGLPVGQGVEALDHAASRQHDADCNQHQSGEEQGWNRNEHQQANVWIPDMSANIRWQRKQPGEARQRHQRNSHHTQPMARENQKEGTLWLLRHYFPPPRESRYAIRFAMSAPSKRGQGMPFPFIRSIICGPWRHSAETIADAVSAVWRAPASLGAPLEASSWQVAQCLAAKTRLPAAALRISSKNCCAQR